MAKGEATRDIAYYEADATGRIVHEAWFEAPYSSMVHDWAVTENFVIFPIIPLTASPERLAAGGPLYVWDGSEDVYLGVVPRKGSKRALVPGHEQVRLAHHERLRRRPDIHIDTPVGEKSAFPWFPDTTGAPFDPEKASAQLTRWTIDTSAAPDLGDGTTAFAQRPLTGCSGEFPAHRRPLGDARVPVRGHQPDRRARREARRRAAWLPLARPDRPVVRGDEDPLRGAELHGPGGDLRAAGRS